MAMNNSTDYQEEEAEGEGATHGFGEILLFMLILLGRQAFFFEGLGLIFNLVP